MRYLLGLLLILLIIWFTQTKKEKTLYERLGGIFPIAAVVNRFSDAIIKNPKIGIGSPNKFLNDWSKNQASTRLPGLKFMRTLWVADITGGPYKYVPTKPGHSLLGLENAHKDLHITSDEFNEVAKELSNSLDYYNVPEAEKNEVLKAFAGHKKEVACPFAKF